MCFSEVMTTHRFIADDERRTNDRRPICVDGLPDQNSLAAMLRRAFTAGSKIDSDAEFADLLNRLN